MNLFYSFTSFPGSHEEKHVNCLPYATPTIYSNLVYPYLCSRRLTCRDAIATFLVLDPVNFESQKKIRGRKMWAHNIYSSALCLEVASGWLSRLLEATAFTRWPSSHRPLTPDWSSLAPSSQVWQKSPVFCAHRASPILCIFPIPCPHLCK